MKMILFATAALVGTLSVTSSVSAQAIIDQGTIQLGVDSRGQLNLFAGGYSSTSGTFPVGLRDLRTGYEATAAGCVCEGWGIADTTNNYSGYANNNAGSAGLSLISFSTFGTGNTGTNSVASGARSIVSVGSLLVSHTFAPSVSNDLFQVSVSITNTGTSATGNLVYRRTMDWDIEPTPFNEYSTIQGVGGNVTANNNGFCNSNPLLACGSLGATGNFVDFGPQDHGANFDISFAPLAAGASHNLRIFYGASLTEAAASAALAAVGANVYSLGQASSDINGGNFSTFMFGFRGVAGSTVPEPQSWALMIMGFGLVGAAMRRKALSVA